MSTGTAPIKRAATAARSSRTKGKVESPLESLLIAVLRKGLPAELSAFGVHLAPKDIDVVVSKIARQFGRAVGQTSALKAFEKLTPPEKKWITTQEAANRCGVSRPFVTMLLDSGAYKGQVIRTSGGHRRVLASEFETLMAQASAKAKAIDLR